MVKAKKAPAPKVAPPPPPTAVDPRELARFTREHPRHPSPRRQLGGDLSQRGLVVFRLLGYRVITRHRVHD